MAGGKVQHWKHGWVPLDEFARKLAGDRKSREQKDAERRSRYRDHLNATSDKRSAQEGRYRDAQNRKAGVKSADALVASYSTSGASAKIRDRIDDQRPFTFDPKTGKVSGPFNRETPNLTQEVPLPRDRNYTPNVQQAVEGLIRRNADAINAGAKIGGRPTPTGYVIGLTAGG